MRRALTDAGRFVLCGVGQALESLGGDLLRWASAPWTTEDPATEAEAWMASLRRDYHAEGVDGDCTAPDCYWHWQRAETDERDR